MKNALGKRARKKNLPKCCFFKMGQSRPLFLFIFGLFKQTLLQFLQQINVKNVHPVSGAGIQTHNLLITSLLP